jgi:hypothetical protein
VALDVGVGEVGERGEEGELVGLAAPVAVEGEDAQWVEADTAQPGLLLELAQRSLDVRLTLLDPATDQRPLLRVDGGVLVALLEQQPTSGVDQGDGGDAAHDWTLPGRAAQPPVSCPSR